ncbi:MAG: hypothetical protein WD002_09340 [Pseudomonadales bacterium]
MRRFNLLIFLTATASLTSCMAPMKVPRTATMQANSSYECRQEQIIGSRLPQYVCRSDAQMKEERAYAQELLRRGDRVVIDNQGTSEQARKDALPTQAL